MTPECPGCGGPLEIVGPASKAYAPMLRFHCPACCDTSGSGPQCLFPEFPIPEGAEEVP